MEIFPMMVQMNAFFDYGFIDGFSLDGKHYEEKSEGIFERLAQTIHCYVFQFKGLFLGDFSFRRSLVACLDAQQYWYEAAKREDIYAVMYGEHRFFNALGNLVESEHMRPFPSELLKPIHAINKPQAKHWRRESLDPLNRPYNGDLSRLGSWGFDRLADPNGITSVKPQYFVGHIEYIDATAQAAENLKIETRRIQEIVRDIVLGYKSLDDAREGMRIFERAFTDYEESHEILRDLRWHFKNRDPYKAEHEARYNANNFFTSLFQWLGLSPDARTCHKEGFKELRRAGIFHS